MGSKNDCDIEVIDSITQEVMTDNNRQIARSSAVVIRRVPLSILPGMLFLEIFYDFQLRFFSIRS